MNELVASLAALSLGGGAAIALLAVWAHFSRTRYAARWRCLVWMVLCLRLLVPVSPVGDWIQRPIQIQLPHDTVLYQPPASAYPGPGILPQEDLPGSAVPRPPAGQETTRPAAPHTALDPAAPDDPAQGQDRTITLFDGLALAWGIGCLSVAMWALVCHLRFLCYLRRWSRPVTDPALLADYQAVCTAMSQRRAPQLLAVSGLPAPMLAGLFRQRLLVPADTPPGDGLRCALYHELSHYQRHDIGLKTLALAAQCLHWFNPLVWYMNRLIGRDIELACDERALRFLPPEARKVYGQTILDAVTRMQTTPAKPKCFHKERSCL